MKTQLLYCVAFTCRYSDVWRDFSSIYHWIVRLLLIIVSYAIIYCMKYRKPICYTYDSKSDNCKLWILLIPCVVFALFFNFGFTPIGILYTFSIYLESISITPQLMMVERYYRTFGNTFEGTVNNITIHYLFCLGAYHALYAINRVYRYLNGENYYEPILWISGIIQALLYIDLLYFYISGYGRTTGLQIPV